MKKYQTGIYKLNTILNSDIIWHKDNSSAIPFKYEYSQKFFNQIDAIILETSNIENQLLFCKALYLEDNKLYLDYGHWELLMLLILLSLIAEHSNSQLIKDDFLDKYLTINKSNRFQWRAINDFYQNELLTFKLHNFIKKSDSELDDVQKVLRDIVEAVWEYTNCIDISSISAINLFMDKIFKYGKVMVILGENKDQSLSVAASMYGSFERIILTNLDSLDDDWQNF